MQNCRSISANDLKLSLDSHLEFPTAPTYYSSQFLVTSAIFPQPVVKKEL